MVALTLIRLLAFDSREHLSNCQRITQNQKVEISVQYEDGDESQGKKFIRYVEVAQKRIELFFGKGFKQSVVLHLYPDRAKFDEALSRAWKLPKTERWMVGAADAKQGFFLSPACWAADADDHDPADELATQMIVTHELTHSFHGQNNDHPDFDGMDSMSWFVEGLATYVSGQEGISYKGQVSKIAKSSKFPSHFDEVWAGDSRYAKAGSIVQFLDKKYGRRRILELLKVTTNEQATKMLGTTEKDLLAQWQKWILKG